MIMHITGPSAATKLIANSMRNEHISKSDAAEGIIKGFLLVDEDQKGEPRYLLEKLMLGESLGEAGRGEATPKPADSIRWKDEPVIVLIGSKISMLDDFETLAQGFTKRFGPVHSMDLTAG